MRALVNLAVVLSFTAVVLFATFTIGKVVTKDNQYGSEVSSIQAERSRRERNASPPELPVIYEDASGFVAKPPRIYISPAPN